MFYLFLFSIFCTTLTYSTGKSHPRNPIERIKQQEKKINEEPHPASLPKRVPKKISSSPTKETPKD